MTREEWYIESMAGGIVGDREQVRGWLAEWRAEYGDDYPITLQHRYITETPWMTRDLAALEGCPRGTPRCNRSDCSPAPGCSCYGPHAPRHIDMGD